MLACGCQAATSAIADPIPPARDRAAYARARTHQPPAKMGCALRSLREPYGPAHARPDAAKRRAGAALNLGAQQ
jgi:hypothetical protein